MRALRLLAVIAFALLPLVAWGLIRLRPPGDAALDAARLPIQLGEYLQLDEVPLPADVLAMVSPVSYSMRLYGRSDDDRAWAYVAFYSGIGAVGAHDPRVCYPSQGWDIADLADRELVLADGSRLAARLMLGSQGGRRELVLYWFQPTRRWPRQPPFEQVLRVADALAGRPQNAFVRLSTPIGRPDAAAERAAEERLLALASELAPRVRGLLDESAGAPAAGGGT